MSDHPRLLRRLAGWAAWPIQSGYLALSPLLDFRQTGAVLPETERWISVDDHRLRLVTVGEGQAGPRILFCHGGGWFIGGPSAHLGLIRRLAAATGWSVTTVDYRLAPRWPIRLAYADCAAALADLAAAPGPLFLMGESAGAAMAFCAALGQPRLSGLILVCPVADLDRRDGPLARRPRTPRWGVKLFAPGWFDNRQDAGTLSPLRQALPGRFAPTLILAAGSDPLRHDAAALRDQLEAKGHKATLLSYPRMVHGFFSMGRLTPAAAKAVDDVVDWMRQCLG
jgi:acetyl esterase